MDDAIAVAVRAANRRMHDHFADIYDTRLQDYERRGFVIREHHRHVCRIRTLVGGARPRVLELGCGTGFLSMIFARQGFRVTGVDLSRGMLDAFARKLDVLGRRPPFDGVTLHCADADAFLAENRQTYDVVAVRSVLHHLPHYWRTLDAALARLRIGGVAFLLDSIRATRPPSAADVVRGWLDRANYRLDYHLKNWRLGPKPPNPDGALADYYAVRGGCDPLRIDAVLARHGCRRLPIAGGYYATRFYSLRVAYAILDFACPPSERPGVVLAVKRG